MQEASADLDAGALGLIGDIGGTNVRLGLVRLDGASLEILETRAYSGGDFESAEDAVRAYVEAVGLGRPPRAAALAVAGPVRDGEIRFTNRPWTLSEAGLRALGFGAAKLLNDYAALALAAPHLGPQDLRRVGGPDAAPTDRTLAVAGPGTGFGASALVRRDGATVALSGEGGHVGFAPADEVEIEILRILTPRFGRVLVERLLSGAGLANLHAALARIHGEAATPPPDPADITRLAAEGDAACVRTVERFCAVLGSVLGDLALTLGAESGVFVGGGIPPRILPILEHSAFRARFEAKGRFEDYMRAIPTQVIVRPHAALLGAADAARALVGRA